MKKIRLLALSICFASLPLLAMEQPRGESKQKIKKIDTKLEAIMEQLINEDLSKNEQEVDKALLYAGKLTPLLVALKTSSVYEEGKKHYPSLCKEIFKKQDTAIAYICDCIRYVHCSKLMPSVQNPSLNLDYEQFNILRQQNGEAKAIINSLRRLLNCRKTLSIPFNFSLKEKLNFCALAQKKLAQELIDILALPSIRSNQPLVNECNAFLNLFIEDFTFYTNELKKLIEKWLTDQDEYEEYKKTINLELEIDEWLTTKQILVTQRIAEIRQLLQ